MIFANASRKQILRRVEDICFQTIKSLYLGTYVMNIYRVKPLSNRDGNDGAEIYCKLFRFSCSLSQYTTQFDVETAINIALIKHFLWRRSTQKERFAKLNSFPSDRTT
jgi:hypothetical protein